LKSHFQVGRVEARVLGARRLVHLSAPPAGKRAVFIKPYHLEEGEVETRFP
jgi:hypothetical protein